MGRWAVAGSSASTRGDGVPGVVADGGTGGRRGRLWRVAAGAGDVAARGQWRRRKLASGRTKAEAGHR